MTEDAQDPYAGVRKLRKFLIVLLVIFCLFTLAYSMVTLNFLKQPLEEKFGGVLKVNGDIKPGLDGFYPTIAAHDVSYGKASVKKFEMRIPLGAPEPGKSIETHVYVTGLILPGRPPINIDLPASTYRGADGTFENFRITSSDSLVTGTATYRSRALDIKAWAFKLDYGLFYPGASGGAVEGGLRLQGTGSYMSEMTQSLNGFLTLKGGKGKIPGRALALWGGNMLAVLLPNDAVVNCAVAEFDMKGGIATATRIAVDTENLNITGTGTIDLNANRMDMVFTPHPKTSSTINTAVPLQVSGLLGEATATPVGAPVAPNPSAPSPCAEVSP